MEKACETGESEVHSHYNDNYIESTWRVGLKPPATLLHPLCLL